MGAHSREPVGQAEPLRGMGLLLLVVLTAWALSLLPGAWGLLGFVPVAALAVALVAPLIVRRVRRRSAEEASE
jgi:membrane protein implicated in regulation of membrane protease activity